MKTYAIADLHGRFDLLVKAYQAIQETATEPGRIVHLGDYVDRGPQSRQIIEFLMDAATIPEGWERTVLCGNHEQIMMLACSDRARVGWWLSNGGGATLISYGQKAGESANPSVVLRSHLEWLASLPLLASDEHRIYVHAGVERDIPLDEQEDLLNRNGNTVVTWMLYPEWDEGGYEDKHVVHGHHQFEDGPIKKKGRTDLDTFAWYTGRLVVGVFDDAIPGGPVSEIEVFGPPYSAEMAA